MKEPGKKKILINLLGVMSVPAGALTLFIYLYPFPLLPLMRGFGGRLTGAYERPGKYEISITSPGYRLWTKAGVRVRRQGGYCHYVETVRLYAQLVRES